VALNAVELDLLIKMDLREVGHVRELRALLFQPQDRIELTEAQRLNAADLDALAVAVEAKLPPTT